VKIYTPEGKRTQIIFGHVDDLPESKVRAAFARWLELYERQPTKVLSYNNPYEAVKKILNPTQLIMIGEFTEKYLRWAEENLFPDRNGKQNPDVRKIKRARFFLEPYFDWPVEDFGPDELKAIQTTMISHEYESGKKRKKYTRRGINDTIKRIRNIWGWGLGEKMLFS